MPQDIAHTAAFLGRFGTRPLATHLTAAMHVPNYRQHTKMLKLGLSGSVKSKVELRIYADRYFAGDISDWKSTSGIVIFAFISLVYGKIKKQSFVAQSTVDTEFVASAYAMLETEGIKKLLDRLGNDTTKVIPQLFNDNQSAIQKMEAASNYGPSGYHIGICYLWLKDNIAKGVITIQYCPTDYMLVDIFIKYLHRIKLVYFRARLYMRTFE